MKKILIIIFIFTSVLVFGDEDGISRFPFVASDTVGALIFAENCLGCHEISSFKAAKPDKGYVQKLSADIDYMIFSQASPMAHLDFLKPGELEKVARFLIYGTHIEGWLLKEYHGEVVEEQGCDSCMKCHDNDRIKKVAIPSCSECH